MISTNWSVQFRSNLVRLFIAVDLITVDLILLSWPIYDYQFACCIARTDINRVSPLNFYQIEYFFLCKHVMNIKMMVYSIRYDL